MRTTTSSSNRVWRRKGKKTPVDGAEIQTTNVVKRLLADAEHFNARISKIDGAGDVGERIVDVVKSKPIVNEAGTAPPAPIEPAPEGKQGEAETKAAAEGEKAPEKAPEKG